MLQSCPAERRVHAYCHLGEGHLLIEVRFVLSPLAARCLPLKLLISVITVPENMECKDLKIQDKQKEYH